MENIQESLLPGPKHYHHPDIIAKVFFYKVTELKNLLNKGQVWKSLVSDRVNCKTRFASCSHITG